MLETLLRQYEDQFGVLFPLKEFENRTEIEVINILYECLQGGIPYETGMRVTENRFGDAPGAR